MQIPVLQTRLNPPSLHKNLIQRPDLMEMLNQGTRHKLTLLSAPAGYGKTTLVSQWLQIQKRTFIWLSIDQIHKDPRIFTQYILSALGKKYDVFNNPFWEIPQIQADWDPLYILGHLINRIDQLELDFILVLDDYHIIDTIGINEILGFLLENLPPCINVILTSRTNPHLPLAKMRGKQELVEINLKDLKFNINETKSLLIVDSDSSLSMDKIHRIHNQNEGWITGIQMMMLAHNRNSSNPVKFAKDYLFEEILEKEDEHLISFLYKTSVLTYLNASLCDALIPEQDKSSEEILKELIKKNLFIKAVDIQGEWFRLHPLLFEVLIEKRKYGVQNLHILAAKWFWEREQYRESFHHFFCSKDYPLTISYLEKCWSMMEQNFDFLPWIEWAGKIPDNEKLKHPLLLCQIAWAQLDLGQLNQSEISLKNVEKSLKPSHTNKFLLVQISSAWSYLSFIRRDLGKTIEYAEKMEDLIDDEDCFTLMQARSYKALAHWLMGNLDLAYRSFERFRDEMIASGVPAFALGSYLALIQIRMQQGRNPEALKLFKEAMEFESGPKQIIDKVKASLHLRAAAIKFEEGNLETMEKHLGISEKLARTDSLVDYHYQLHQFRALACESDKKWERALKELDEAGHLFIQTPAIDDLSIDEQKTRIWIRMRKKTTARKAIGKLMTGGIPVPSFQNESGLIIKIRYSLTFSKEPGELETALNLLNQLMDKARCEGRDRSLAEILILDTCLLYKLNRKNEAYDVLMELLGLADKRGFVQIFLLEKEYLEPVFKEFSPRLKDLDAYQHIRDYINAHDKSIQILSYRELEVLKLMTLGLSNRSIGEKLFVAESTIKGHNQRIFQKLNVTKRTEAIAEGHKMGLID